MKLDWTLIVLSSAWVGFAYAGYPLILILLARWSPRPLRARDSYPPLSVIIAVHNGEHALRQIARPLSDPSVGSVSREDVVDSRGGEGAYVRFEMALRRLETETSTLVGLSGSFFAIRRELAAPWPNDLASDFRCALEAVRRAAARVSGSRPGA
jgi:hypothetical protein